VKVLDFGLAKAWTGEDPAGTSSGDLSRSPTLAHTGTAAGLILGTAAYMSPEQARGRAVDKRTDVWAFGVLLWEMLTGRSLFAGDTVTDVIAAVVTREPDLDALPAQTPRTVRRLLSRCLRKDPRTRLPDMGAARLELQEAIAGTSAEAEAPAPLDEEAVSAERRGRTRERWAWAAVALVAAGLAAGFAFVHLTQVPAPRPAGRFVVEAPEGWTFVDWGWPVPSPDGRQIVFRAVRTDATDATPMLWTRPLEIPDAEGRYDLWVKDVARGVASRVTSRAGSERDPVWSPDGRSLAFAAMGADDGVLRRKGLRAADPETLLTQTADEDHPEFWSRDGQTLLFVRRTEDDAQSIWALSLTDGEVEPVFDARFRVDEPQLSPDDRWLAYVSRESGRDEVYVEPYRRDGDRVRVSLDGGGQPKWRGDGKELFYTTPENLLMAVALRPSGERLEVGLPARLFEIQGLQGTGYDDYAPSADGRRFLVKLRVEQDRKAQLHVVTNWTSLLE
jgi:hypothetical protein